MGDMALEGDFRPLLSFRRSLTRAGLAGMGTGLWMPLPPPPPLEELLMILSILNELTRPPTAPLLLFLGGVEAGLAAPPPSLLLPLESVLNRCFLMLGEPLSKSRNMDRFLGEMKWGPSLTSTGLVGRRGMSAGEAL